MKEQPNYYAILSAEVRYDNRLKANVKLLYAEITALCNMNAECFASNKYFAELYGKSKTSISIWISELVKYGYIKVHYTYKEGTKEILNRYISILKGGIQENLNTPYKKTVKSNTTSNNTMNINTKGRFLKPTIIDIKKYCTERKNNVDCETFFDFYESKDWLIGKNKMKNWKACVRTWEKRNKINNNDRTTAHRFEEDEDYGDGVL
tara:strand:+ start:748 stop:1368 length:621 start_codon:yes stop_codon:yes gene_type:complete